MHCSYRLMYLKQTVFLLPQVDVRKEFRGPEFNDLVQGSIHAAKAQLVAAGMPSTSVGATMCGAATDSTFMVSVYVVEEAVRPFVAALSIELERSRGHIQVHVTACSAALGYVTAQQGSDDGMPGASQMASTVRPGADHELELLQSDTTTKDDVSADKAVVAVEAPVCPGSNQQGTAKAGSVAKKQKKKKQKKKGKKSKAVTGVQKASEVEEAEEVEQPDMPQDESDVVPAREVVWWQVDCVPATARKEKAVTFCCESLLGVVDRSQVVVM